MKTQFTNSDLRFEDGGFVKCVCGLNWNYVKFIELHYKAIHRIELLVIQNQQHQLKYAFHIKHNASII